MKEFENLNPTIFTVSAIIVGFLLIDDLNALEQNSLGNWFMLVGQLLETNSAQQQLIESNVYYKNININSKLNKELYNPIIYNIDKLHKILNETNPNNMGHIIELLQKTVQNIEKHINDLYKYPPS